MSFIYGVARLQVGLDNTVMESLQGRKHLFTTTEPRQYLEKVTCFNSLCRKPFSSFILYLFM